MNKLDTDYQNLLQDILDNGTKKTDRTGTGTVSVFGRQIRHKMSDGFPLLTTKKMSWKTIVTELIWFLRGDTNIKYLIENGCHIWDGDAYKKYENSYAAYKYDSEWSNNGEPWDMGNFVRLIKEDERFCSIFGELGPIYGKQWRGWPKYTVSEVTHKTGSYVAYRSEIDQIENLIINLKNDPDSRRLMVNAWNVGEVDKMTLPPCHHGFQLYTRELSLDERIDLAAKTYGDLFDPFDFGIPGKVDHDEVDRMYPVPKRAVSLMWYQRSVDTFLGLPFNIASYGLLLEILAKEVDMVPEELIGNLGDTHLYLNHIEQAKEQIGRTPYELPKLNIKLHFENKPSFVPEHWLSDDFVIEKYESHPTIKAPLSN